MSGFQPAARWTSSFCWSACRSKYWWGHLGEALCGGSSKHLDILLRRGMNKAVSFCWFVIFLSCSFSPTGFSDTCRLLQQLFIPWWATRRHHRRRRHRRCHGHGFIPKVTASKTSSICQPRRTLSVYSNVCNIGPSIVFHFAARHFDSSLDVILFH